MAAPAARRARAGHDSTPIAADPPHGAVLPAGTSFLPGLPISVRLTRYIPGRSRRPSKERVQIPPEPVDQSAVLRGLRLTGDEAQFTRVIASVAGSDPRFAARFVQLVLDVARLDGRHRANVTRLGEVPSELVCLSEHRIHDEHDIDLGRVDLRFDGGDDFTLLIENKLYSGFGHQQLERYHAALATLPPGRSAGLIAITRDVPSYGELDAGTDGWLGAIRWARLYDAQLADLKCADPDLTLQWHLLIEMMHDQGDLGVTTVDSDLIKAWTRYAEAQQHLVSILGDVRGRALETLRDRLHSKYRGAKADLADQHHIGYREAAPYWRGKNAVWTAFRVPASLNCPTVTLNFWAAANGRPVFSVEVRPWRAEERLSEHERQLQGAARRLTEAGLKNGKFKGEHVWWSEHEPADYLHSEDVPTRLLELIESDLTAIVASGVLSGEFDAALLRGRKAPPKVPVK
jgi:hypothetical protein